MSVSARQVVDALTHRYGGESTSEGNVSSEELVAFLRSETPGEQDLLSLIATRKPEWIPMPADLAIIRSVQDCWRLIFNLVDLEDAAISRIRQTMSSLAADLIKDPTLPFQPRETSLLGVQDLLLDATIGWSEDQGRAGEKLLAQVDTVIASLAESPAGTVYSGLAEYLEKEGSRTSKLEERLAASEAGKLRSKRCRSVAAETLNKAMKNKLLTAGLARFLQGPWFESVQLLAITRGLESDEFIRACKLTETLIWTYQPINEEDPVKAAAEKQKLYRIIEHLPAELKDLLLALEHSSADAENVLAEIENDHVMLVSGHSLQYADFDLIQEAGEAISQNTSVSRILLRKVASLNEGHWFTYSEGDKHVRIKLVLKLDDVKQMLFTNRNGMKALEKTYNELAYLMSSGVIKPLNHESIFSSTFLSFYNGNVEEHQRKLEAAREADVREAEFEAARQKALQEAAALARAREDEEKRQLRENHDNRIAQAIEEARRSENQAALAEMSERVSKLQTGAWLKLPAADGTLEECKLAVRVASADKLIFVNRSGVKLGEYNTEALVSLLVTGAGEIGDTGIEFEDTLAQVVSKLRQDRGKSYDDLTGES